MGKSNGVCKICSVHNETVCHLLFQCGSTNKLWTNLSTEILYKCNFIYEFSMENVLFGILQIEDETLNTFLNLILFEAKWQL